MNNYVIHQKLVDNFLVERNHSKLLLHCQNIGINIIAIYESYSQIEKSMIFIWFHHKVFFCNRFHSFSQSQKTIYVYLLPSVAVLGGNIKPPSFLVPQERSGCTFLLDDQSSVRILSELQLFFNLQSNIYFFNRIVLYDLKIKTQLLSKL